MDAISPEIQAAFDAPDESPGGISPEVRAAFDAPATAPAPKAPVAGGSTPLGGAILSGLESQPDTLNYLGGERPAMGANTAAATAFMINALNSVEGVKQLGLDLLEQAGILPAGTSDRLRLLSNDEVQKINDQLKVKSGMDVGIEVAHTAGGIAPFLYLPPGPHGASFLAGLGRIATQAASGAVIGASTNSDKPIDERMQGRTMPAAIGGAMGATVGTGFEVVNRAVRGIAETLRAWLPPQERVNAIVRGAATGAETAPVQDAALATNPTKFAEEGIRLDKLLRDTTGGSARLKLTQLIDDPYLRDVEQFAAGSHQVVRNINQMEKAQSAGVAKYFVDTLNKIFRPSKSFGEQTIDAFNTAVEKFSNLRRASAAADFNAAIKAGANKAGIELRNFKSTIDDLISQNTGPGVTKQQLAFASELARIKAGFSKSTQTTMNGLAGMQTVTTGQTRATIEQFQNLLSTWGDAASGTGSVFKDLLDKADEIRKSAKLFAALQQDLDAAVTAGGPGADLLRMARDNYRRNSEPLMTLRETALGRVLGEAKFPRTPEELQAAFGTMTADQITNSMRLLQTADPTIHKGLQRFWLERQLGKATLIRNPGSTDFNAREMIKMFDGPQRARFEAIYDDPATRQSVMDGLKLVERIMTNTSTQGGRLGYFLKSAVGVAVGANPIFASRLASELFTPQAMSRYIDSREGLAALHALAQPYDPRKWSAAVGILARKIYGDSYDEVVKEGQQ